MTKKLLEKVTGPKLPNLEYSMKYRDFHRERFETGDWTDDSDQMILILQTLLENKGKVGNVAPGRRCHLLISYFGAQFKKITTIISYNSFAYSPSIINSHRTSHLHTSDLHTGYLRLQKVLQV